MLERTLPRGFTKETAHGGWKVLGPLADFQEPTENACKNVLRAIVRDFKQAHVDFGEQKPPKGSPMQPGLYQNQVSLVLPADRKPLINSSRVMGIIDRFEDWFANVDGVNVPYVVDFWLEPSASKPNYFVFDSSSFFPLDAVNSAPEDRQKDSTETPRNFLFTTELHTAFRYNGTEEFNFRGDDDVFVFINHKLAVDIGGIHGPLEGNVNLASQATALGLEVGKVYNLDLFQAERNPTGSNFRIETSLDFTECGILPVEVQ